MATIRLTEDEQMALVEASSFADDEELDTLDKVDDGVSDFSSADLTHLINLANNMDNYSKYNISKEALINKLQGGAKEDGKGKKRKNK